MIKFGVRCKRLFILLSVILFTFLRWFCEPSSIEFVKYIVFNGRVVAGGRNGAIISVKVDAGVKFYGAA